MKKESIKFFLSVVCFILLFSSYGFSNTNQIDSKLNIAIASTSLIAGQNDLKKIIQMNTGNEGCFMFKYKGHSGDRDWDYCIAVDEVNKSIHYNVKDNLSGNRSSDFNRKEIIRYQIVKNNIIVTITGGNFYQNMVLKRIFSLKNGKLILVSD